MEKTRNVVIIGSGPAGLTAAIYAARANLKPLVIEGGGVAPGGNLPGGQLMTTTEVENFPGFPTGIMGPELMASFRSQAERFGTDFMTTEVTRVDFSVNPFKLWLGEEELTAKSVIMATGARSLMLGLPRENELLGRGVSTCATCDGFFFTDQEVAVVGGGDSAMEEALFLTKFATKVTVIHRRDSFKASKIMQERVLNHPKIKVLWNSQVTELIGAPQLEAVKVRDTQTDRESELRVNGLFVAIGHAPNTELFKGQIELDKVGYVKTKDGTKTSVDGVFAAGDVQDHIYRQAITAAGSGCMAAIDAERWLSHHEMI